MPPAFLTQRPQFIWRAREPRPLVRQELRAASPALADDFATLDEVLLPMFHELDANALEAQNAFRRGQVVIIVGGALATALGAVQAALGGGVTALGVAGAIVSGGLAAVVSYMRGRDAQREYLTSRLKAEQLRGEYFRFLGRVDPYDADDPGVRRRRLRDHVEAIELERPT
jgi:hypothetical protein